MARQKLLPKHEYDIFAEYRRNGSTQEGDDAIATIFDYFGQLGFLNFFRFMIDVFVYYGSNEKYGLENFSRWSDILDN